MEANSCYSGQELSEEYFSDENNLEDTFYKDDFNPLLVEYNQRKTHGFLQKNAEYFDEENFYL